MIAKGTPLEIRFRDKQGKEIWCSATADKFSESVLVARLNIHIPLDYDSISTSEDYPVWVNYIDGDSLVSLEGRVAGKMRDQVYGIRIVRTEPDRHEYASLEDSMKVHYKMLDENDYFLMRQTLHNFRIAKPVMPKYLDASEEIPQALLKFLGDINHKLERILTILESSDSEKITMQDSFVTTRVGGGFLIGEQKLAEGYYIMRINIPIFPYHEFYAMGQGRQFSSGAAGILFTYIGEDDREELIKYVFERQREVLKSQRKQK
ncbi:hypothetical protein [Desulfurispira natronophila]|uniref:PilZ domain-containing protein n=1 Tax=Desulfurispira natronophila TaxID=682562 RepID=A0A7W8DGZ4_9BACT|nr:hypothetical protein [Desulfurispira natronophila]MBB5021738.1 hypothetical protein [Desulfurispira natronophila]